MKTEESGANGQASLTPPGRATAPADEANTRMALYRFQEYCAALDLLAADGTTLRQRREARATRDAFLQHLRDLFGALARSYVAVQEQRDEILAAARTVAGFAVSWEPLSSGDISDLRAAIAKAEGR